MSEVGFIISKDGSEIRLEVDGVEGAVCEDIAQTFIQELGDRNREGYKDEYYATVKECGSC